MYRPLINAGGSASRIVIPRAGTGPLPAPTGPTVLNADVLKDKRLFRREVMKDMDSWANTDLIQLARTADQMWQPSDFLPDASSPDFLDQVAELRKRTRDIPDELLVVLVGDMITEEALPTYMSMINRLDYVADETGSDETAWAMWTRLWTAEENRHGDALHKYLWLTGRVNLRSIEVTIQHLIGAGMQPRTGTSPYCGFVYTSFQERATKISHGNTARLAKESGDGTLAKLAGLIAADEGRHEVAYQRIIEQVLARDPDGAMLAFADMMKKQIVMPAHMMDDHQHAGANGGQANLFDDFALVAERLGCYRASDYAAILDYLIRKWDIQSRHFVTGEAAEAQEFVVALPDRIRRLAERAEARATASRKKNPKPMHFSWVFDRPIIL